MTATKVWEFVHPDSLYISFYFGSLQRFSNGNTLINFLVISLNIGSIITEVDSSGQIVFSWNMIMEIYTELINLLVFSK